ncbi:unnamed protein product [Symbiodinium natans]|uniref:C3H1-type domain-containing protein n=1 Tax=Symbiodinium natans TaxID=878477 RepID=A0A812LLR6_9DINO|nr:unnamed protein product [Symbiodinium natans]
MAFRYKNTFIDECSPVNAGHRSNSCPPAGSRDTDWVPDITQATKTLQAYVTGLPCTAAALAPLPNEETDAPQAYVTGLPCAPAEVEPSPSEDLAPEELGAAAQAIQGPPSHSSKIANKEIREPLAHCNPGSRGHPALCKRPCVYISTQGVCQLGDACEYCHFQHRKVKSLDKRQRDSV